MFPQNFEYRMRFLANEWAAALSPLLFAFGLEKLLNYVSAFSLFSFFFWNGATAFQLCKEVVDTLG